jgi:hypothetical protein
VFWLESRGLPAGPEIVQAVLARAKKAEQLLTEEEILEVVQGSRAGR